MQEIPLSELTVIELFLLDVAYIDGDKGVVVVEEEVVWW